MNILNFFTANNDSNNEVINEINSFDISTLKKDTPSSIVEFFLSKQGQTWYKNHPSGKGAILLSHAELTFQEKKSLVAFLSTHTSLFTPKGMNPLQVIAMEWEDGKLARNAISKIKENGGDVYAKDGNGMTALHYAVKFGKEEITKALLENEKEDLLFIPDKQGKTPFHWCILKEQGKIFDIFCRHKTTKNTIKEATLRDNLGLTTVDYAQKLSLKRAVHVLERGLGADLSEYLAAIEVGDKKKLLFLAKKNSAIHQIDRQTGYTLLSYAVEKNNRDVVEFLLDCGADVNLRAAAGLTPLYLAAESGNMEMVKLLLDRKANPNLIIDFDWTASLVATHKNHFDVVRLLGEYGAENTHALHTLSGIWGVTIEKHLDGNIRGLPIFIKHARAYLKDHPIESLSEEERQEMINIITKAEWAGNCDPITLAQRIRKKETILLQTGWDAHAISMLFTTINGKAVLFEGNRGAGTKELGIKYYEIGSLDILEEVLEALKKQAKVERDTIIDSQTIAQKLKLTVIDHFPQKGQKVGNCWWVSLACGLKALSYKYLSSHFTHEEAKEVAKKRHKEFTKEARQRSVQDFVKENPKTEIPTMIRLKMQESF